MASRVRCWQVQCREPRTGQQKVQLYYEDDPLIYCLSMLILFTCISETVMTSVVPVPPEAVTEHSSSAGQQVCNTQGTHKHKDMERLCTLCSIHRRRIDTEEKAKVIAAVWGPELIQLLAALAILPRTILKNRMKLSFSFKSSWCNSSFY